MEHAQALVGNSIARQDRNPQYLLAGGVSRSIRQRDRSIHRSGLPDRCWLTAQQRGAFALFSFRELKAHRRLGR